MLATCWGVRRILHCHLRPKSEGSRENPTRASHPIACWIEFRVFLD
uniref:Uncharacterized protein n=1 Tax=Rhizophora mucronata TaxID=61149 RepID=A0A2P2IM51_RHIMU